MVRKQLKMNWLESIFLYKIIYMTDIHSHLIPGVDDGAQTFEDSFAMIKAAQDAGVKHIVCTPHVRDPYFNYDLMRKAFELLQSKVPQREMRLSLGWEVNIEKLLDIGLDWANTLSPGGKLLLEFPHGCHNHEVRRYCLYIRQFIDRGIRVIIAHPERYATFQRHSTLAGELAKLGCEFQISS
ncbi:MAG: hypothetical protein HUJ62_06175, partial [Streptococcus gallolyticus]|nr:hypothetical protein [Streptococcus gallolyticus]